MGVTYVEGTVSGPKGSASLSFLADSGATYTVLPLSAWQSIGLSQTRTMKFALADGTMIERQVSEARISITEGTAHSPVVLGEEGDEALLGIVPSRTWGSSSTHSPGSSSR